MSKRMLITCITLAMCPPLFGQQEGSQLKIGDPAPGLGFDKLMQAPEDAKVSLDALHGKVVVLHFWGPHAQPCTEAFAYLNKLAKKFQGKPVQFIAITSSDEDTAKKYSEINPIEGWIGIDRDFWIFSAYSATPVPHVVVIDKEGRVAAMVKPQDLTEAALNDILAGKAVNLPVKQGKPIKPNWKPGKEKKDEPEPILQITIAPCDASPSAFRFGIDKTRRRLTARAVPLPYLVALAYRAEPGRVVCRLPQSNDRYRVSLVVPKGMENSIYSMFQEALDSTFNLKVTWQKHSVPCLLLKKDEGVPLALTEMKKRGQDDGQGHTGYGFDFLTCSGVTMAALAADLETVVGAPVFDETEVKGRFDVTLRYKDGNIDALKAALKELGLRLEEDTRQIKLLVIDKADEDD